MKIFNKYGIIARVFPAIITSIPAIVFYYFFLSIKVAGFMNALAAIHWVENISIPIVFVYLLTQVNRFISKELFEKRYFGDELRLPTTNFLMHQNDQYSNEYKKQLHQKIENDFGVQLSTQSEEVKDEINARRKAVEAVSLIRRKIGKGTLLLQFNIEYGFVRNLIGGSVIALGFSLLNCLFFSFAFSSNLAVEISLAATVFYAIPILLSKILLVRYGNDYAKILIQEYMAS